MGEADGLAIIDSRDINTSTFELVNECLIVISSHTGPASALYLGVENSLMLLVQRNC